MTESVPFRPFTLDLALEDARPASARVPEGYYLLECDGCDTPTVSATSTGVRFLYHIVSGPDSNPNLGIGGKLRDFNTLEVPGKDRNHFPLTATLVALGRSDIVTAFANMQAGQNRITSHAQLVQVFQRISQAVKGHKAVGDIRDRVGQSQPFSSIEALHPESEWETFKRAAVYGGQNGPSGMGPVPVMPGPNGPTAPAGSSDLFSDLDRTI